MDLRLAAQYQFPEMRGQSGEVTGGPDVKRFGWPDPRNELPDLRGSRSLESAPLPSQSPTKGFGDGHMYDNETPEERAKRMGIPQGTTPVKRYPRGMEPRLNPPDLRGF